MKLKALLIVFAILSSIPANAQTIIYNESYCYQNFEQYIPGYYDRYGNYIGGYVRRDRRRVSCNNNITVVSGSSRCNPARTTLGGLIGGGTAADISKQDAYGWAIPLGAVLGMGLAQSGCD